MQNLSFIFFFTILFSTPCIYTQLSQTVVNTLFYRNTLTVRAISNPPIGIRTTSIEQLIRRIYFEDAIPSQTLMQINNRFFMVYRGIEITRHDKTIFIFSRGYAKTTEPGTNDDFIQRGAAAKAAHIQFLDSIVPPDYPLISFDYDDGRYGFAFGQKNEINTLQTVYDAVLHSNPEAHIIILGDCRGAKVALELAAQRPKNLRGLILMSPFISGRQLTDSIAAQHLSHLPGHKGILHRFFKWYFKSYKPELDNLAQRLSLIDPHLPIFIGHRRYDQLITNESINSLVSDLRRPGNKNVHLVISDDQSEPHSKLTTIPEIQQGIAQFITSIVEAP